MKNYPHYSGWDVVLDPDEAELSDEEAFVSPPDLGSVGEDDFVSGLDSLLAASVSEELVFLLDDLPFLP
ncbi:MAG: hypothetical protein MK411_02120 [SAR202 cluster bacterium]|nr:hypothetical protein [SAR202 cluster bacterium]